MASEKVKEIFNKLKTEDLQNKICIDCNASNPQWASVNLGIYFCLECAGIHRSLEVHISFVRSISMDVWSDDQLNKMKAGGNSVCSKFFQKYGFNKNMSIRQKYDSKLGEIWRDRISKMAKGEKWVEPSNINELLESSKSNSNAFTSPSSQSQSQTKTPKNNKSKSSFDDDDDWEKDWEQVTSTPKKFKSIKSTGISNTKIFISTIFFFISRIFFVSRIRFNSHASSTNKKL